FGQVREREEIGGKEQAGHRLRVARWLSKTMIEASATRASYVRDHAIHHLPALLIGIEVLIKKMPQKAPTLRNSYGVHAFHRRRSLRIMFQVRKKIAHRGHTNANHSRILG